MRILTIVLEEGRSERGYNPETPSNFRNNLKETPLDDTPTEAGIGGACHLVKLLWLHPMADTRKQVERLSSLDWASVKVTMG